MTFKVIRMTKISMLKSAIAKLANIPNVGIQLFRNDFRVLTQDKKPVCQIPGLRPGDVMTYWVKPAEVQEHGHSAQNNDNGPSAAALGTRGAAAAQGANNHRAVKDIYKTALASIICHEPETDVLK